LLWISDPDMFLNPNNSAPYFSGSSFDILWFQFAMWPRFFVHVRRPSLFFHIRIPSLWSSKFDYLFTKCKKTEMRFSKQNLRNFFFSKSFFLLKVWFMLFKPSKKVYICKIAKTDLQNTSQNLRYLVLFRSTKQWNCCVWAPRLTKECLQRL